MKFYEIEKLSPKQVQEFKSPMSVHNEYICETAGFVPLEVKFKRFEQAGIRAQISASDYTSSDYRDMYLNPDYQVYPDDEIEEVEEKFKALHAHIQEVKKAASERAAKSNGSSGVPGTEEAVEKKAAEAAE